MIEGNRHAIVRQRSWSWGGGVRGMNKGFKTVEGNAKNKSDQDDAFPYTHPTLEGQ